MFTISALQIKPSGHLTTKDVQAKSEISMKEEVKISGNVSKLKTRPDSLSMQTRVHPKGSTRLNPSVYLWLSEFIFQCRHVLRRKLYYLFYKQPSYEKLALEASKS